MLKESFHNKDFIDCLRPLVVFLLREQKSKPRSSYNNVFPLGQGHRQIHAQDESLLLLSTTAHRTIP